jgi:CRISPR-associated endoribonuclease Cas6
LRIYTDVEYPINGGAPEMQSLSQPRQKGITVKMGTPQQSKLVGYHYNFKIKDDRELLRMGYYCGFGEKNSMGFGCCEIL